MKKLLICISLLLMLPVTATLGVEAGKAKTLATVNGIDITNQEVQHFISKLAQPVSQERALQEMINVELLSQAAKKQGLTGDADLQMEIKRVTTGLIASNFLQKALADLDITTDSLKQRYQKEYVEGVTGQEYNANHILLKTEQEAKDIIKQLDDGANFESLAKKHSTGPSGSNGGALGWFKPGDMVSAFSEAAQALKPGSYSKQPVKTQFGWHVIMLNKTRAIEPPSFESVQQQLTTKIASEKINEIMKNLRDSASIVINDSADDNK